jgi:hypothetical protein
VLRPKCPRFPYDLIDPMLPLDAERHIFRTTDVPCDHVVVLDSDSRRWDNGDDN